MRILHVTAQSPLRCGIRNFGEQLTTALRRAGAEVDEWDANYSTIHRREEAQDPLGTYLPKDASTYDVVHVNWHPITTNTYNPEHFDQIGNVLLSVYLHDLPPWSSCPFVHKADARITSEPDPLSTLELIYPVVDWVEDLPNLDPAFTVGWTGIRGDGLVELEKICAARGWKLNLGNPNVWLSLEDEIRRLARSTVNVCWYKEDRGRSGAASTCLASGRPLIVNDSPMLAHFVGYHQVVRGGCLDQTLSTLNKIRSVEGLHFDNDATDDLSWSRAASRLLSHWSDLRESKGYGHGH